MQYLSSKASKRLLRPKQRLHLDLRFGEVLTSCRRCSSLQSSLAGRNSRYFTVSGHGVFNKHGVLAFISRSSSSLHLSRASFAKKHDTIPKFLHFTLRHESSLAHGKEKNNGFVASQPYKKFGLENDEEESIPEVVEDFNSMENEIKEESMEKKRRKKTKNPLPSQTIDGKQLTFVEETKVFAELDALIKHGRIHEAIQSFNNHRRRGHKFTVEPYNQLLHGIATHGSWPQVHIMLHTMKSQNIEPNFQTFAALIEACWHQGEQKKLANIIKQMEINGFSAAHIFHKCCLTKYQADAVFSALKSINPDYKVQVPPHTAINTQKSASNLLKRLAEPAHPSVDNDSVLPGLNMNELQHLCNQQIENEVKGYILVPSVEKKRNLSEKEKKRKGLYLKICQDWCEQMTKAIKNELQTGILDQNKKYAAVRSLQGKFIPYLKLVEPEKLSEIVINDVVPILCSQPQGVSVNYICRYLGALVHASYAMKCKKEAGVIAKVKEICNDYLGYAVSINDVAVEKPRDKWQTLEQNATNLASLDISAPIWPYNVKVLVAGVLIDILIRNAKINTEVFSSRLPDVVSALSHGYSSFEGRRFGILKMHPAMARIYKSYLTNQGDIAMETEKVPMLVPPRPWTSVNQGGYLVHPTPIVRTIMDRYQLKDLNEQADDGKLTAIYDSLNYLGTTCWKVNTKILDIMIDIFNGTGDTKLEIFGPDFPPIPKMKTRKDMTEEERQAFLKERKALKKFNSEIFALRMDLLYKLSVANFLRHKLFWLPSNMDFRGRVYPVPPHCSHLGSDVARGMLVFGRGRPLGKDGLDWLKIHLVNLHGSKKKASLKERVEYANEMIEEIMDSADNPMNGRKWWQAGDEPWQCLACCIEITNVIRSPEPAKYVSHLPVHQDGSCNGLQHYAAMGHDKDGAMQVNLIPCEKPQDLYAEVANLVEKKRLADAAQGHNIAMQLEGKVNRKVVKQTVMTIVYGVTFVGGRLQIEKQLRDLNVSNELLFKGSTYLADQVFKSIGELFRSARNIQAWLKVAATQISLTGHCVNWITPLGLPVTQPYHRETTEEIPTPVQNVALTTMFDNTKLPHTKKQKAGFAPNFVHSLDSCHMMLTSLHCQREGIAFASVHDSFWTHASTVPIMSKVCREQFVALHEEPILEDLQKYFQTKFGGKRMTRPLKGQYKAVSRFGNLPAPGSFDLKQVLESIYFFS
eukprot:gene16234-17872_t